ncbi:GAP family protein [Agromyces bauzanensis]|uniref:GAP family protein n=1 Tax=Agromyces bauzanensis TaxID=1308924 RepID=A0A917PMN9_9MICO|nr:GAP family protein [Agromyces bauzanensis]GGJ84516.1 hypothetical protein GCM10011372_23500 [Agromyces bauzanensis]
MLQVIGQLLPLAVALAVSSVPIMATLLILLSPGRTRSALPFLTGWVIGMALVVSICAVAAQAVPTSRSSHRPDPAIGIAEILVGVALAVVAVVTLRGRRRQAATALPKWLRSVGTIGPWSAFGLALILNVRPKGLLLAIAAGLALRAEGLSLGESVVAVTFYTIVGASTVAAPIIATVAAPDRTAVPLRDAQDWLLRNGPVATSIIVIVIAAAVIGTGIARL